MTTTSAAAAGRGATGRGATGRTASAARIAPTPTAIAAAKLATLGGCSTMPEA
ncbi:MAG: hypothetical protein H6747_10690 [Deltaproteobacteria bacterium]|nr:hypothetical protein [Deltaproteobacteria bacterium]